MHLRFNQKTLKLTEGDITALATDAIVNAANSALILGAGVAGAIRERGGPEIQAECNDIGYCPVGEAVITTAGNLPARHVIHAVGPQMGEGNEDQKLRNATLNSLKCAESNGLQSIAFPAISSGIFGFPIERCAETMLGATNEYLRGETGINKVVFCLFGDTALKAFQAVLSKMKNAAGR